MNTRLIQVVAFVAVGPSATVMLPHQININGIPQRPDFVAADANGFTISVDASSVSVTNNGSSPSGINVWLELKHSIPREFGLGMQTTSLVPRPFVAATGGGGGGGSNPAYLPVSWTTNSGLTQGSFVALHTENGFGITQFTAVRAGLLIGISTSLSGLITPTGSILVTASINGANQLSFALAQTQSVQPQFGFATPAPQPYAAGDQIGINVTVSGDFQPNGGIGMQAWLEALEVLP